jgi:hypothetical protein
MKLKLRTWVKVVIALLIIVGVMNLFNNFMNNEIENCVNSGKTREYCEYELSK